MPDATAVSGDGPTVTIVNACLRDGHGGSPTAVLDEQALSDDDRRIVPVLTGTSHAVFVSADGGGHERPGVSLRFFTATGELPACGHGTVAALAYLADRAGRRELQTTLRTKARTFGGHVVGANGRFDAEFDAGTVELSDPMAGGYEPVLHALGLTDTATPGPCVATLGRARLLVPVSTRDALAALAPDVDRLRDACDRRGLLGCYVYCAPPADGRVAARMFAPSIGVAEDIANANSTACLAVRLARDGMTNISVDMGDALGAPATITATTRASRAGPLVRIGGSATIARIAQL